MNSYSLLGILLISIVNAQSPQFKTLATIDAIGKIKDILVPIVQPKIQGLTIPDVSGSAGTINYYISNIIVSSFQFGPSSIVLENGVEVELNSVSAILNMDWSYSMGIIKGSGSATDSLGINLNLLLSLGESNGKPVVGVSSLSLDITSIDISVHGGGSWFYQILVDLLKNKIEGIFANAIQSQLSQVIDQVANYYLKNTPTIYQINSDLEIDYSLVANPNIQPTYSATSHLGAFQWIPSPSQCVYQPLYLPETLVPSKLMTFVISETLGDCIASVLYMHDILDFTITPSMVPSNSPIHLNTSDSNIRRWLPGLYAKYPNAAINIEVFATEVPNVIINATNDRLEAVLIGDVRIQVQQNHTNEYLPAFVLGLNLDIFTLLNVSGNNAIVGSVDKIVHNTTLIISEIGPIDMKSVDVLVSLFIGLGVQPQINKILANGFPIPNIDGVQLTDGVVYYRNGYLQVGSDFTFSPQGLHEFLNMQIYY